MRASEQRKASASLAYVSDMISGRPETLEKRHGCVSYFPFGVSRIELIGPRGARKHEIKDVPFNTRITNFFLCGGVPRGRRGGLESLMDANRRFTNFEGWSFIRNEGTRYLVLENHHGKVADLQTHVRNEILFGKFIQLGKYDVGY